MNSKYTVITTFHQAGLEQYGQRCVNTYQDLWPAEVDLIVCAENCSPIISKPNVHVVDLLDSSADLCKFIARHKDNPFAHGKAGPKDIFNPKKQFRWDAVRFAYKVFSVALCADRIKNGWMIWLDADTHTHSPLPLSMLETLCPDSHMISYLGRGDQYHSECGWVGYNLDHPDTRKFIQDFVDMYRKDDIFNLPEWHDSYVWDQVRKRYPAKSFYNLNTQWQDRKLAGHPFINSVLGRYMDHVKGARKQQGHSKSLEVKQHLDLPYWQNVKAQGK